MDDVERQQEELIRSLENKYPGNSPEKVVGLRQAAKTYRQIGLPEKAIPLYEKILAIETAIEQRHSRQRVETLVDLSLVYGVVGRHGEGAAPMAEAVRILRKHYADETAALYSAMNNLAGAYLGMEKYRRAEAILLGILKRAKTVLHARPESIAATHHQLGVLYTKKQDYQRAEESFLLALSMKRQIFGESHPQVGMTLSTLAFLHDKLGRPDAEKLRTAAASMMSRAAPPYRSPARANPRIQVRCIDPGDHARELLGPFLGEAAMAGFEVDRVVTVATQDIYDELILPPIVTLYVRKRDMADGAGSLDHLATSLSSTLARFRQASILGYGSGSELQRTSDLGVFVHWDDDTLVRYYFTSEGYAPAALVAIPTTFVRVAPRLGKSRSSLANVVFWRDGRWQWFESDRFVPLDPDPSSG